MPRTKRRFADDDPPTDESSEDPPEEYVAAPRGGGKQLRMMSAGGKQLMRPPPQESEEESSSEDEEEGEAQPVYRGGGKQFRHSGGKQLRVAEPDSDSDDDDDEEEEEVNHVGDVQRGGGKSLMRMQHSRSGGKQLRPTEPESDSDEDSDDEEEEPVQPAYSGGKQLRRPPPSEEDEDEDDDAMDVESDEEEDEDVPKQQVVTASPGGGKSLRRPMGGKQLRPPPSPEPIKEAPPPTKKTPADADDMEESSSSEEEQELDMETFDTQTLVKDEADQKHLDSLPEIEREAILGERFDKLKAAQDMRIALRESKRKEREERKAVTSTTKKKKTKKTKKQEASDAALAAKLSASRESQRNRDAKGAKKKKAEALKAFREERKNLLERKEEEEDEDSDLDFGDDDDDDDSDDDYEEKSLMAKPWQKKKQLTARTTKQLKDDSSSSSSESENEADRAMSKEQAGPDAELDDYIKITIPRRRLAQWCNEPYFEQVVMNCFVRLGIGEVDGKKCYRLCEVIDVVKSKSEYKFPALNKASKPIFTNKALRLKIGKNEKEFPMYLVSDSRPTDEDMQKYVEIQKGARMTMLSKSRAKKLRKNLDQVVHNYKYTHEDIEKSIEARKKRGKGLANIGLEQTRSKIAVQAAKSGVEDAQRRLDEKTKALLEYGGNDDDAAVVDLEKEVNDAQVSLDEAKRVLQERLQEEERVKGLAKDRKRRLTKRAKDRDWAKVNERAALVNQTADFDSYKSDKSKSTGTEKFNPYARRKVKPKMLWEVGQSKKEDEESRTETRDEADASKAAAPTVATPAPSTRDDHEDMMKADVESHQFAIDEEVLAQSNGSSLGMFGLSSSKPKITRVRKGLSFQEYNDRKAAGTL